MKRNKLFLYSLSSLAVIAASAASAEEMATAPSLEGGFSAMIGGTWMAPSVNDQGYNVDRSLSFGSELALNSTTQNFDNGYEFGWQAAIGYVFDNTANGVELSYRGLNASDNQTQEGFNYDIGIPDVAKIEIDSSGINADQSNKYGNFDLMFSQFLDVGTHVQMRFLGGISYLNKLDQTTNYSTAAGIAAIIPGDDQVEPIDILISGEVNDTANSSYDGLGPRVGADARYDFGTGFGIVGGASIAYFLGSMETSNNLDLDAIVETPAFGGVLPLAANASDTNSNHAVTNLRANLGIDYVYYFDNYDLPTLGLELGYEVDTYLNGVSTISPLGGEVEATDVTFSGPYLNIKGVF